MNQLVFIENNKPVTDSLTIAEVFGKDYDKVIRDIHVQIYKLKEANERQFSTANFVDSTYISRGKAYAKFELTEDAFTLVAMSYTTPDAMKMKVKFIQEFKKMREQLTEKVIPLNEKQSLVALMKLSAITAEETEELKLVTSVHCEKLQQLETKVEEQITLDHGEQRRLQKGVARRVYGVTEDKKEAARLFRELYREIKDRFGVASYKDVKRKELQSAISYIENWVLGRFLNIILANFTNDTGRKGMKRHESW